MFLEVPQNSQENTCARVSFLCNFIKKETLAQVFSCERCEISKNTFSYECFLQSTLVAASENWESDFSSFAKIFSKDIFQGLLLLHIMSRVIWTMITPWSFLNHIIVADFKFRTTYNSQKACQWLLLILVISG